MTPDNDEPEPNPGGYNYQFLLNTAYNDSIVAPGHRDLAMLLKRIESARGASHPATGP